MALNTTYAVRLGSIVAGITWIVLILAPGSRTEETTRPPIVAAAQATSDASTTTAPPQTVPPSTAPVTTAGPTSGPAPSAAPTTSRTGAPGSTTARVFSLRELVGVRIDRGATWIAIATVTIVDQTGAPAAGVEVTASWSFATTAAACRTDSLGECSMYQSGLPADLDAVTITITAPQNGSKTISRGIN